MRKFRFSLETALALRKSRLDLEESVLALLLREYGIIEQRRRDLRAERHAEETRLLEAAAPLDSADLAALAAFQDHVRRSEVLSRKQLKECRARIERQQEQVRQARRRVEIIETLKERKLQEWRAGFSREVEILAEEAHLAGRRREQAN
jgi:flagellar export protein FliJ